MIKEMWKPVPGYRGLYEVSSGGLVRSVDRVIEVPDGRRCFYRGRLLKQQKHPQHGYMSVGLSKKGKTRTLKVHLLVLRAFVGSKPEGEEVGRHLNDVRDDNRIENLAWGTHKDNAQDCVRNGHRRKFFGSSNHFSKLTEKQVKEIWKLRDGGLSYAALGERFGVSAQTVFAIIKKGGWKHVRGAA